MIHDLDLTEYIDKGHTTARIARGYAISWRGRPSDSQVTIAPLDPFACECAVCQPMRLHRPVVMREKQLDLWRDW